MIRFSMLRSAGALAAASAVVFALTACGTTEVEVVEPEPTPEAEPEPEPEPEPTPEAAPAGGPEMTPEAVNAARADHVGKMVTVKGLYMGTTKQGDPPTQLNIAVHQTEEMESQKILCVAKPEEEAKFALTQKDAIVVTGKVAANDFFGSALLEECTRVEAAAGGAADAPAEGAPEGKTGKGKGKNKAKK